MTDTILTLVVVMLLAACWVALMAIHKRLLQILTELQKRNYIEDLGNRVTTLTQRLSSLTKTTQLYATNNPLDESEPPNSTL